MAQDKTPSILGLFDSDLPRQVIQQRNAADMEFAQQASGNKMGLAGLTALAGRQLGHAGAAMFGMQDPELERATKIQQVTKMVQESGIDPSDADSVFPAMMKGFQQAGLTKEAMMVAQHYQGIQAEQAKAALEERKVKNSEANTGISEKRLGLDSKTKADDLFVIVGKAMGIPGKLHIDDYTEQEAAAIYAEIKKEKLKNSAASGTNIVLPGEKKFAEEAGKDVAAQNVQIEGQYSALDSVREAKALLDQGIYAGFWGATQEKIAEVSGGSLGDMDKVRNTQTFRSFIGETVIPRLKEFGGNDSNEELKYLTRIMGGDTSVDPKSLNAVLTRVERKIAAGIDRAKRQQAAVAPNSKLPVDNGQWSNTPSAPATPKPTMRWDGSKLVPVK